MGCVEHSRGARKLRDLLSTRKQVEPRRHLRRDGVRLGPQGSEVEERGQVLRRIGLDCNRGEQERAERGAARPPGVVYLSYRRDIVRIEPGGLPQRFGQRHRRERIVPRGHQRWSLQLELECCKERQHQSASTGTCSRLRNTKRPSRRNRFASHATTDGNTRYATGTTNSVRAVEKNTPPTIAYPSGLRAAEPAPTPHATGTAPMIVATDVMRIGRSRIRPASRTAETVSSPRAFSWLVYSTSRIEFLLTRPISKIMPISLYRLIVAPEKWSRRPTSVGCSTA